MEGGIVLCHWYFLLKASRQKRRERGSRDPSETEPQKPEEGRNMESEHPHRDIPLNPIFSSASQEEV